MEKKGFSILSIVCLGAAFLYLVYASIGLFQDREGLSSINGFKTLFIFLLWFQLCRLLSKRLYGAELVMPAQDMFQTKLDNSPYDTEDKRYLTILDYIALVGAWIIVPISTFN